MEDAVLLWKQLERNVEHLALNGLIGGGACTEPVQMPIATFSYLAARANLWTPS